MSEIEERTPREILADKAHDQYLEIAGIINKYVPLKAQLNLKLHQHFSLREYLASKTDEEIHSDYVFETEFLPKCPIMWRVGEPEPEYPLKAPCCFTDCPQFSPDCWGAVGVKPITVVDLGDCVQMKHKGWSDFRQWLYENKRPTPVFRDKKYEKKYY